MAMPDTIAEQRKMIGINGVDHQALALTAEDEAHGIRGAGRPECPVPLAPPTHRDHSLLLGHVVHLASTL